MAAVSLRGTLLARGELENVQTPQDLRDELERSQGGCGLSSGDPPGEGGVGVGWRPCSCLSSPC